MALLEEERQKVKTATEAANMARCLADLEAQKRVTAEKKAKQVAEEKQRIMEAYSGTIVNYRKYTIEEIESSTNNFSDSLKIGEGGYGPVYRGMLDHTAVAIKVLRPDLSQGLKQFKQEVFSHSLFVKAESRCIKEECIISRNHFNDSSNPNCDF